jgi:uncharacterized protein YkwD
LVPKNKTILSQGSTVGKLMHSTPRLLLAVLLGTGLVAAQPSAAAQDAGLPGHPVPQLTHGAPLRRASASAADIPFIESDLQAEQRLLALANESRKQEGAPLLALDSGLSHAARIHAQAMLAAGQLSHRFDGEPSLPQRLATMTGLQLDEEGENIALDYDADRGHAHLMLSPPHRANLLNPAYNVVGLGVVRSGDRLFIVQDFGHALPSYSVGEWKDRIAAAVNESRHQSSRPDVPRRDQAATDDAACSMAQAGKLGTTQVRKLAQRATVLSYTSLHPETLPDGAARAIASGNLRSFSVGACYSRTEAYPTGVYWVVLALE